MATAIRSSSSLAESSAMAAQRTAHSALATLDDILASSGPTSRATAPPSPTKKRMMERAQEMSVSTPALMDLLPARKKPRMTVAETVNAVQSREKMHYNPHSTKDLLDRLATYSLTLWNDSKPASCSAVDFAKQGWRCTGKRREEVVCQACEAKWALESVKDWRSEQGQQVASSIRSGISSRHAGGCPWRDRPCPANLYRIPASLPPALILRTLLEKAIELPTNGYSITHPLTDEQLKALQALISSEWCQALVKEIDNEHDDEERSADLSAENCILALFGWQPLQAPTSGASASSGQALLHCTYCARRVMLKPGSSTPAGSAVNVRTAHRRWCAHLQTDLEADAKEEPWLVVFDAITRQKPSIAQEPIQAQDQSEQQPELQEVRLDKAQTKNAVSYVKQLLAGGRGPPRRQGLSTLSQSIH